MCVCVCVSTIVLGGFLRLRYIAAHSIVEEAAPVRWSLSGPFYQVEWKEAAICTPTGSGSDALFSANSFESSKLIWMIGDYHPQSSKEPG